LSERSLGVALVGLRNLSTKQLAPALARTTRCHLAGVVTGSPERAAEWKATHRLSERNVYDYATMERMAENDDIDIVYVATPNGLHAGHTIAAAKAGKHVLCEKPMATTVADCEAMIAACRAARRQLAIAYRCRFEPHHMECARLAREGVFGPVRIISANFGYSIGDAGQWRLDRTLAGGGALMDVGVYALQSARVLTGEEPIRLRALETKTDPAKFASVDETMAFQLELPSGALADCVASFNAPGMNRLAVHAERGAFGLEPAYPYWGVKGWRSDGVPLAFAPVDQFAAELDDFARCVSTGAPTAVPGEEGLRDVRIMLALYEAARDGGVIDWT
jgi:predicted dehydrogenase